jgi:hypothetical protein
VKVTYAPAIGKNAGNDEQPDGQNPAESLHWALDLGGGEENKITRDDPSGRWYQAEEEAHRITFEKVSHTYDTSAKGVASGPRLANPFLLRQFAGEGPRQRVRVASDDATLSYSRPCCLSMGMILSATWRATCLRSSSGTSSMRKVVRVFLVEGKGVDVKQLFFADKVLENTSVALEEASIDHDRLVRTLDPMCS